jgi:D-alanyl-D-alanine carboxypeptidase (penicillin-binding protein 5/6)
VRPSVRKPVAGTLCALITAGLVAIPAAAGHATGCPGQAAPPAPIDSSETLAPGEVSPTPLPEPATPAGGPTMAMCGYLLPTGAPPLPKDLGFASWVIQDLNTGAILAAKDPHARERPASLIKLLLAQVVARELNPATVVVGTQADANQQGTRVGLGPGGRYTVGMLVKALLMASGNDAAYALATLLGGVPATIDKMNALARQLGAADTRAATPSGLDGPGMSTSAYDLSIFFRVDMATPMLADAMSTRQMAFPGYGNKPGFMIDNDNLLLRTYTGDMGGKTGYTDDAQQTYADAAVQGGHRIALIMMRGTNHLTGRWQNARELMNYGFALENTNATPIGHVVTLAAAGATTGGNGAPITTSHGNAQLTTVPQTSMSTFGNVGLPLTVLAAIVLVLIGFLYLRREKAKKARAAAAARVASAETVRVALPRDLAPRRISTDDEVTAAFASQPPTIPPPNRQRPPMAQPGRTQAMPSTNGHPVSRPRPATAPRPSTPGRPTVPRPSTTTGPEWPSAGPEWPT